MRTALCLTFDVDAETMWTSKDGLNGRRPSVLSQGVYEIDVGLPLILRLLAHNDLKATFFVPGWVADHHPEAIAEIAEQGHEIGHHGYLHDSMDQVAPERERDVLLQGIDAIERAVGTRPRGYRAPLFDVNEHTWGLLRAEGFLYSSNLMSSLWPMLHPGEPPLVELPVQWMLDDGQYYLVSMHPPNGRQPYPPAMAQEAWRSELEAISAEGGLTTLTMHPQLSGRPSRLRALQSLLDGAREIDGIWMPTLGELADSCLAAHLAALGEPRAAAPTG